MLERVGVDEAVRGLRPDFAVLVMSAEGLRNGPSDQVSEGRPAGAGDRLAERLGASTPDVRIETRLIGGR